MHFVLRSTRGSYKILVSGMVLDEKEKKTFFFCDLNVPFVQVESHMINQFPYLRVDMYR